MDEKSTGSNVEKNPLKSEGKVDINYAYTSNQDSVKVIIKYSSDLDTINPELTEDRYTLIYVTEKEISFKDLEEMIEEDNTDRFLKEEILGYDFNGNDSIEFFLRTERGNIPELTGIIDDIVFLKNYKESGETRMIRHFTHFKYENDLQLKKNINTLQQSIL